jgi:hypothetical protein
MSFKLFLTTVFLTAVLGPALLQAGQCLTADCHSAFSVKKYVHGPIAAEQAGAKGCVACHIPAGKECSATEAGKFNILAPPNTMCQSCHAKGNDTLHSAKELDCLKCHDPHGSDTSPVFER